MRARVLKEEPRDVEQAVEVLLELFARNPRPRPLYGRAIRSACRILKVMLDGDYWLLPDCHRHRLAQAGLRPRVQRRWNNAWAQLCETHTFRDDRAQRDIATGKRSPRAEARVKAVALPKKKEPTTFENYALGEIKRKIGRNHKI